MKRLVLGVCIAAVAFVPRILSLDRTVTFDETLWLERGRAFTSAVADARFSATVRSGHPGVTTMWIAGLAQQTLPHNAGVRARLARSRVGLAIADAALIAAVWWIALGLFGMAAGTLGALLLALDPFLVAHNRVVHIDGLVALAMLASFLALMRAGRGERRWLIASGVFAGIAVLTKAAAAVVLLPAAFVVLRKERAALMRTGAMWCAAAATTAVALWPAMWVAPWKAIARVATGAGGAASANPGGRLLVGGAADSILFYPATLLWRTTIVTLPVLIAVAVWAVRRRTADMRRVARLLAFAAAYVLFTAAALKRADRYALPAMVAADVAVAAGIATLLAGKARAVIAAASIGVLALHAAPGLATHPHEIASHNWLAGGPPVARHVFTLGFGEGLDQMAAELNRLPNAASLTVGSTHLSPFAELFAGNTVRLLDCAVAKPDGAPVDLVLFYISSVQSDRYRDAVIWREFKDRLPLRTVTINGIPYVRVYEVPQR